MLIYLECLHFLVVQIWTFIWIFSAFDFLFCIFLFSPAIRRSSAFTWIVPKTTKMPPLTDENVPAFTWSSREAKLSLILKVLYPSPNVRLLALLKLLTYPSRTQIEFPFADLTLGTKSKSKIFNFQNNYLTIKSVLFFEWQWIYSWNKVCLTVGTVFPLIPTTTFCPGEILDIYAKLSIPVPTIWRVSYLTVLKRTNHISFSKFLVFWEGEQKPFLNRLKFDFNDIFMLRI